MVKFGGGFTRDAPIIRAGVGDGRVGLGVGLNMYSLPSRWCV